MRKFIIMVLFTAGTWAIGQPTFSEFDLNNDRKITQSELEEARTTRMKQRSAEGRMLRSAREGHSFKQIDINKDGFISEKEFILHQRMHHKQACVTFG